jgi:hypothetical protein
VGLRRTGSGARWTGARGLGAEIGTATGAGAAGFGCLILRTGAGARFGGGGDAGACTTIVPFGRSTERLSGVPNTGVPNCVGSASSAPTARVRMTPLATGKSLTLMEIPLAADTLP